MQALLGWWGQGQSEPQWVFGFVGSAARFCALPPQGANNSLPSAVGVLDGVKKPSPGIGGGNIEANLAHFIRVGL
jgi:hypothetical protein